jgi:hypothetical protein
MITLFQAFISQCELFLLGFLIVSIRYYGYDKDELFKDFKNKYFTAYVIFLWFVLGTFYRHWSQLPVLGIWSYLLQ